MKHIRLTILFRFLSLFLPGTAGFHTEIPMVMMAITMLVFAAANPISMFLPFLFFSQSKQTPLLQFLFGVQDSLLLLLGYFS